MNFFSLATLLFLKAKTGYFLPSNVNSALCLVFFYLSIIELKYWMYIIVSDQLKLIWP